MSPSQSHSEQILSLSETGASNRFVRALRRLKQDLATRDPGGDRR
jgi:hypothetical protein